MTTVIGYSCSRGRCFGRSRLWGRYEGGQLYMSTVHLVLSTPDRPDRHNRFILDAARVDVHGACVVTRKTGQQVTFDAGDVLSLYTYADDDDPVMAFLRR